MSRRHRSESVGLPPEELRAHARSERHRIHSELHLLSSAVGVTIERDDADEPGPAWKPVHHHDAERGRAGSQRSDQFRHWKQKAWKRRTLVRRRKAEAVRYIAQTA
jgi:hypothetical protein